MTYDDIEGWAIEAYPTSNYDSAGEWINDVMSDFKNQGHFFPAGVAELLNEYWENHVSDITGLTNGELFDIEASAVERASPRRNDFDSKQEYEIAKSKHEFQIAKARKRVRPLTPKERRKVKARQEIVARLKKNRKALESKRKARREKGKQKFTKRLSKKERKRKRGIGA